MLLLAVKFYRMSDNSFLLDAVGLRCTLSPTGLDDLPSMDHRSCSGGYGHGALLPTISRRFVFSLGSGGDWILGDLFVLGQFAGAAMTRGKWSF